MSRAPTSKTGLDAITIEGSLISPEMVARIAATEPGAKTAADYDCPKGTNLRDEIARYFRIGQAHWQAYHRIEVPTATQTAAFAHALLAEAFGFTDLSGPTNHQEGTRRYRIALEGKDGRVPIVVAAPVPGGDGFAKALPEFGDGEGGRARRNPVVLLQDWLNANPAFYWGLVFAGDRVRLMRDNASLTRAAWIEADMAAIFRDEMFADFTALWLLIHASRFGAAGALPSACALERWREEGQKQGTAARDRLREGVEEALRELGQGLVSANLEIRRRIESGEIGLGAVFDELLRTVYRLIFLAVAEDRDLLHPRSTSAKTRALYRDNYGFAYWRERSARRVAYDMHHDAWEGIKVVFAALARGEAMLGLPALGGLFDEHQTPLINGALIPNGHLLMAIHRLGFLMIDGARTRINWRDMKTEELGSVYESLLEIRPILNSNGDFTLDSGAKGNARKTSGSYYTPDSLVETLLDSALDPVLERAETAADRTEEKIAAILDIKVIDPACGSGHFLLGAARRMAERVAELRDPDAPDRQAALRDVVSRCIYGVDRNPMAVELAKVALWIESVTPGAPLGFLDANIRCGDSLLGVFNFDALEHGVPDDAYQPLTGDDKAIAKHYRQQNHYARHEQGKLDWTRAGGTMPPAKLAANVAALRALPEDTLRQIEDKRRRFAAWRSDPAREAIRIACDLYVAAFLLPKNGHPVDGDAPGVPTTAELRLKLADGPIDGSLERLAVEAATAARAFHWPVEFPDVMIGRGGFDVVLGNPPWERIKLQEQEFFAGTEIAEAPNAAARTKAIEKLENARDEKTGQPDLAKRALLRAFSIAKRSAEAMSLFARVPGDDGGRYRYTGTGDVNTYALFAEHFLNLTRAEGRAGIIVPTGIATDATTAPFFAHLVSETRLARLFDFENSAPIFHGVHRSFKFCLLTMASGVAEAEFAFFLTDPMQLEDQRRRFTLSPAEIARINPNTKTAPVFRARADADLTAAIYNRVPVFIEEERGSAGNPWDVLFMRMFDMSNDSGLFRTAAQLETDGWVRDGADWINAGARRRNAGMASTEGGDTSEPNFLTGGATGAGEDRYIPLYEAKMIHQFDHRWATYDGLENRDVTIAEKEDAGFESTPRYWVLRHTAKERLEAKGWTGGWLMGWRDICRATDYRTVISGAFPALACNDKYLLMLPNAAPARSAALLGNLNSLVQDFAARQKIGGTSLKYFTMSQLPILPPSAYTSFDLGFIVPRVLELSYTSRAMAPFARDLGYDGPPFAWVEDRRAELRAELDAWYALAYGLSRDELRYVLDPKDVMGDEYPSETFRVLQKNEMAQYGEYRTRRLVLAAYDVLSAVEPITEDVPAGEWQHQLSGEIDVRHLLAALVRRMHGPKLVRDVVHAMLFAARPHLLMPHLDAARQREWRRLVGPDADLPVSSTVTGIASGHLGTFGEARGRLAAERALRFDPATGCWDRGASIYQYRLPAWCEGRADFVWHALRSISLDTVRARLSQEEQTFVRIVLAA